MQLGTDSPVTAAAPRWFVVDDEALLLNLAGQILRRCSVANVQTRANPCEALAHMTAAPADLELLVTDLNMPGMNGLELARRVHEVSPLTKVLLTTGSTLGLPDRHALKSCGVDFLLTKPFSVQQLMTAVRQLCGAASFKPSLNH